MQLREIIVNKWQEEYSTTMNRRRPFQFLLYVRRQQQNSVFQRTLGLMHFLSEHGPCPKYFCLFQCECGATGTPEHVNCSIAEHLLIQKRPILLDVDARDIINDGPLLSVLDTFCNQILKIQLRSYRKRN